MAQTTEEKKEVQENAPIFVTGNEQKQQAMDITEEARQGYEHPSFGAQLFLGKFDTSLICPFPRQSEADKKIGDVYLDKIEKLLVEKLDPEQVDATREIPKEVIDALKEMGMFAIKIPKKYGGLGLSQTNYNRIIMKVASHCGSTAVLLSAHQSIGVPQPLKMYGTEEQKQKFLPRFAKGSISAFALTEPDVGSDPAQMSCEAKLSEDGKYYILNGDKLWCTNGTVADIIVVIAKTAPKIVKGKEKKQISAFILEMNTPGVEIIHRCEFMGLGAIYNGLLRFKDVKIPVENRIGDEGRGLAMALGTVNVGRLTLPSASTAAAKQCLSICRRWGKERKQWGAPVGLHEPGAEKIAHITSTTFAMEAITWLNCAWADKEDIDIRIEAAMGKLFCTEALWEIVDMTMQLRGGRGYEKASSLKARGEPPYPVERMMRDCRINMILEGASEIMKLFLAREAMDFHLKKAGPMLRKGPFGEKFKTGLELAGFYATWLPGQWLKTFGSQSYKEVGRLEPHFQFIERQSHKLAYTIFKYMAKYQQKLEKRQLILGRLMEIATSLFAMAATCAYAASISKEKGDDKSPMELADYFCSLQHQKILNLYAQLDDNLDRYSNELAKKVLDGNYKWLEEGVIWVGPRD